MVEVFCKGKSQRSALPTTNGSSLEVSLEVKTMIALDALWHCPTTVLAWRLLRSFMMVFLVKLSCTTSLVIAGILLLNEKDICPAIASDSVRWV